MDKHEFTAQRWYVVQDDEVGGWAIANVSKPTSEINGTNGKFVMIGQVLTLGIADYVCNLHNRAIEFSL